MADAEVLNISPRKGVRVRLPPSAPTTGLLIAQISGPAVI